MNIEEFERKKQILIKKLKLYFLEHAEEKTVTMFDNDTGRKIDVGNGKYAIEISVHQQDSSGFLVKSVLNQQDCKKIQDYFFPRRPEMCYGIGCKYEDYKGDCTARGSSECPELYEEDSESDIVDARDDVEPEFEDGLTGLNYLDRRSRGE